MKIGDRYNWKNQSERLVYLGKNGLWFQFAKVGRPGKVWCEIPEEDLHRLEKTILDCICGTQPVLKVYNQQRIDHGGNFTVSLTCTSCGISVARESEKDSGGWNIDNGEAADDIIVKWNAFMTLAGAHK